METPIFLNFFNGVVPIIGLIFLLLFIIWQWRSMQKYTFKFDMLKVNTQEKFLTINGYTYNFHEISHITINELEQPTPAEKLLTKGGAFCYMSEIIFHLHNGTTSKCKLNYQAALYKNLKLLEPYIQINADIEKYKTKGSFTRNVRVILLGLSISIIIFLLILNLY